MRMFQRFCSRCAIAVVCMSCYGSLLDGADHGAAMLPTVGSIERLDPRLDALVPTDARIEVLAICSPRARAACL